MSGTHDDDDVGDDDDDEDGDDDKDEDDGDDDGELEMSGHLWPLAPPDNFIVIVIVIFGWKV